VDFQTIIPDIGMALSDSSMVAVSGLCLLQALKFISRAKDNAAAHDKDAVVQQHFLEHFLACIVSIVGAGITLAASVAHLVEQNILLSSDASLRTIEYFQDIGCGMIIVSVVFFMMHMQHEETKGHPFYCREYGEDEA